MISISKRVYTDDPAQPSRSGSTSDATINVTNQRHLFFERGDGPGSLLKMTVRGPLSLGLKRCAHMNTNKFVDRMLTACNLLLKETRLSTDISDTAPVDISQDKSQERVRVENKPGEVVFAVTETIGLVAHAEVALHSVEDLDEAQVREVLDMIHAVYAIKNPSHKQHNLQKSLRAYSEKITARHRVTVFQGLFEALEMAINFNNEMRSNKFDATVRNIIGDPNLQIGDLRDANNRFKHHDSNTQMSRYPDDAQVFRYVRRLRPITANVLLYRLRATVGKSKPVRP